MRLSVRPQPAWPLDPEGGGKRELGVTYTPLRTVLKRMVAYYRENPPPTPAGYRRRRAELKLYQQIQDGLASAK